MSDENVNIDDTDGSKNTDQTNKSGNAPVNSGTTVPISRLNEVLAQKKQAIDALQSMADELKKDIPEKFQEIVPALEPLEQVKWIRNATSKGLFTKIKEDGLDTKRSGIKPKPDYGKMQPDDILKAGYSNK